MIIGGATTPVQLRVGSTSSIAVLPDVRFGAKLKLELPTIPATAQQQAAIEQLLAKDQEAVSRLTTLSWSQRVGIAGERAATCWLISYAASLATAGPLVLAHDAGVWTLTLKGQPHAAIRHFNHHSESFFSCDLMLTLGMAEYCVEVKARTCSPTVLSVPGSDQPVMQSPAVELSANETALAAANLRAGNCYLLMVVCGAPCLEACVEVQADGAPCRMTTRTQRQRHQRVMGAAIRPSSVAASAILAAATVHRSTWLVVRELPGATKAPSVTGLWRAVAVPVETVPRLEMAAAGSTHAPQESKLRSSLIAELEGTPVSLSGLRRFDSLQTLRMASMMNLQRAVENRGPQRLLDEASIKMLLKLMATEPVGLAFINRCRYHLGSGLPYKPGSELCTACCKYHC